MSKPYTQTTNNNKITRIFENTLQAELVWHRDRTNRIVKIVEGQGWKFQMDNDIPKKLCPGDILYIPKNTYHRLIKGNDKLVCEIREL